MTTISTVVFADGNLSNFDVGRVIKAGTQNKSANIKHIQYCSKIGGIDITNNFDVSLGKNTLDAVFCQIVDNNKYNEVKRNQPAGIFDKNDNLIEETNTNNNSYLEQPNSIMNGNVRAEAANGTVPMGQSWWVRGAGYFSNISNSSISIAINAPDFGCSAENHNSRFSGNATLTAQVTCAASRGRPSTKDYATACINGNQCSQAVGTIYFR